MEFEKATLIEDIDVYLNRCKSKHERICLILLFMLGALPKELLLLQKKDFQIKGRITWVYVKPVNSRTWYRSIPLPQRIKYVVELNEYLKTLLKTQFLLKSLRNNYNIRDLVYRVSNYNLSPRDFRINRLKILVNKHAPPYLIQEFFGYKHLGRLEVFIEQLKEPSKNIRKYF